MSPLRDCLTEDPIQMMFTGYADLMREVESFLFRRAVFFRVFTCGDYVSESRFRNGGRDPSGMLKGRDACRVGAAERMVARRRDGHRRQP